MKKLGLKGTLGVMAVTLAVVGGGGAALAASNDTSPSPSVFLDSVAKHLGISTEKLQDATKAAAAEQVDAALEQGQVTKEQADAMKERIEAGEGVFFGGPGPFGKLGFHGVFHFGANLTAAAEYLALTAAELREKLDAGQSLADVTEAAGRSVDGLKQALLEDAKDRLDEAVSDGDLTREQADSVLDDLESRVDDIVDGTFAGPRGFGLRGVPAVPLELTRVLGVAA